MEELMPPHRRPLVYTKECWLQLGWEGTIKSVSGCTLHWTVPSLPGKRHIPISPAASIIKSVERLVYLNNVLFSNTNGQLTEEPGIS
jgi:hypothetical protein